MNTFFNIEPKIISMVGVKILITIMSMELNKYAIVKVELFSQDRIIETNHIFLEDEEYTLWQDDSYLINYVCQRFGYTLLQNE